MPVSVPRSFTELITLGRSDDNMFVGQTPDYPWGRVYGGQVVAQSLAAAAATVPADHFVHSLHAYFVLGGVPLEPIEFDVTDCAKVVRSPLVESSPVNPRARS